MLAPYPAPWCALTFGVFMENFPVESFGAMTIALVIGSVLCTLVISGLSMFMAFKVLRKVFQGSAQNNAILQNGLPGTARVMQLGAGGMTMLVGGQRSVQLAMTLEVQLGDGSPPYQAQLSAMIPEIAMPRIQPGQEVPVKVDPANRAQVAIDLRAMGYMV